MSQTNGATNTQKTVMLSLAEGWMLRYVDLHGWCLFQPGRSRPFARVKKRTVDGMTAKGWLTPGIATKGLGYRPAKELTSLGRRYAERLLGKDWANQDEWDPFDQRVVKKGPKEAVALPEKSSVVVEPNIAPMSPLRSQESLEKSECASDEPARCEESNRNGESTQSHGAIPINRGDDDSEQQRRFRLVA
jgi:hypothetical protein